MERGIRKILTFVKLQIASKSFGKIIPHGLLIENIFRDVNVLWIA